ncbi:hypothetical protein Lac3_03740 [Claveliimonas bilis]|nr:hypothetical protein Lac3_03740 [Claveliimonas bilis]
MFQQHSNIFFSHKNPPFEFVFMIPLFLGTVNKNLSYKEKYLKNMLTFLGTRIIITINS